MWHSLGIVGKGECKKGRREGCVTRKGKKTLPNITATMKSKNTVNTLVQVHVLMVTKDEGKTDKLLEKLMKLALSD